MICMAILAVVVMTNCSQKEKYVNRYYCYDDDDGMEIVLKDDGTVECLYGIYRVHLKGTYHCEFPNVFVQFPNDSIQIADCIVTDLPNLPSSARAPAPAASRRWSPPLSPSVSSTRPSS